MTRDEGVGHRRFSYALFTNGSSFGLEVLRRLLEHRYPPEVVILPQYPPAPEASSLGPGADVSPSVQHPLLQLEPTLELGYAPAERQPQCAALIRRQRIDFILVACWPYLIEPVLFESPAKAALNLHPSLLPLYRGPDPITAQLADRRSRFGVSLHLLNHRFDRGDIVLQRPLANSCSEPNRDWVQTNCARLGSDLFLEALNGYYAGWDTTRQDN